ncbi:thiamine phosphate synthase [Citricoccus sp. NR2]|uniref:thiamine phosphate synthase n=1 Tax=Citricoccus sp. NR2 TaxID=3004095 RepID=UPI0022DD368F|nr:thiamine phosphate synthase [Citricoccus sp. NR2]WBL19921.1 thiamine phosphate synthase [Citricoccus sp. NR2]
MSPRERAERAAAIDWSLYHVTDTGYSGGPARVPEVAAAAVAGGATVIQVRDKTLDDDALIQLVRACRVRIVEEVGVARFEQVPLFVNDRLEVARVTGCHLHVGQSDDSVARARGVLGEKVLIGLSTSSAAEVDSAARAEGDARPDVIGIGPVWVTATKPDAAEPLGIDGLRDRLRVRDAACSQHPEAPALPAVAIGGIDRERARSVAATGVDGICVVSAIASAPSPRVAAARLREEVACARPQP